MDGGPEGVWISADKARRRSSIVTTRKVKDADDAAKYAVWGD
jgi:hypothetical protein